MENRMRLFLLWIGLSAAGGQNEEELRGIVGGNITLTDSILQRGFLLFKGSNIASVKKGEFDIEDKTYENRVHWNKQTGLFTIKDLQISDSGLYKLESKIEPVFSFSYQLRVFERVPAPAVRRLNSSSEGCWLLCWVGRNTSLWWQRGQQVLTHSSSASSLLLPVDTRDFSSSLSCVASSPAENKTVQVSGATSCALNPTGDPENRHSYWIIAAVTSAGFLIAVVLLSVCFKRRLSNEKTTVRQTQGRLSQEGGGSRIYANSHIQQDSGGKRLLWP
ncbi:uncharacterized protein ACNS7B_009691 isoform 2-T2 [Menidia menidia]